MLKRIAIWRKGKARPQLLVMLRLHCSIQMLSFSSRQLKLLTWKPERLPLLQLSV